MTVYTPLIIIALLLLNFYLFKKNIQSKKLYITTNILLILYITITIAIYYNNIALGYKEGFLFGDILNSHFCDEFKYFTDSRILHDHFINGDFHKWITKQLPVYEFVDPQNHPSYGNYNFFVLLLTMIRMLGLSSPIDFILIKLLVYIPTAIYLYKLAKIYLEENYAIATVIIFSLLPGYILTNTLLMRDNIIIFAIIALIYYIFSNDYNLFIIIPLLFLVFVFRSYTLLVIIATLIFTFRNARKIISIKDIVYLGIIVFTIYFFTNYKFSVEDSNILFSFAQIQHLQDTFRSTFGSGLPMLGKLFYLTGLHIVIDPLFINFLTSGVLYLTLISIGNILGILLSILSGIKFIFLSIYNKNSKIIYLLKFTFYFILLNALIIMAKDAFIINRLALMWMPLFIIILLYGISLPSKKTS